MSSQDSNENREDRMPRPLRVYCSISPFEKQNPSFVKLISDTSVQLELQDDEICGKRYTFAKIFTENTPKEIFDEVALPLVQGLIDGKSGVLFTCGVSMKDSEFGLKPSCLDVLFNSIANCQAGKFIFKPAGFNEFKIQSEDEAAYDRDVDRLRKNMASQPINNNSQEDGFEERSKDETKLRVEENDNKYAIFISYFCVFRNQFYDILDDKLRTKKVADDRDAFGNTYVRDGIDVEVKNANEAIEVFRNAKQRIMGLISSLKVDFSLSHFVFTIKLVKAPRNASPESVEKNKGICVSQLSLVDLATSRRSTGPTSIEVEKENHSLMLHIRKCIETIREGKIEQLLVQKDVPYAAFTKFLLRYHNIRMICCATPEYADAYENAFVMQFAEETADIKANSKPLTTDGQNERGVEFGKAANVLDKQAEERDHKSHPNETGNSACPQKELIHNDRDYKALQLKLKQQEFVIQQQEYRIQQQEFTIQQQEFMIQQMELQLQEMHSQLQKKDSKLQKKDSKLQKIVLLLMNESDEDAINV